MKKKLIVCSKSILGGAAVFAGTRVPVKTLVDYFEAGRSLGEFLDDFPSVSRRQAIDVLNLFKATILARFSYARAA